MAKEQRIRIIRVLAMRLQKLMRSLPLPASCAAPGLYSIDQFRTALERERARADRNGHQVSLVLIRVNNSNGTRPAPHLIDALKGRLRLTDEAGWFDPSRVGILMPYTSCNGAWHVAEDVCRLMKGKLSLSDCTVYTYPYERPAGNGERQTQNVEGTCTAVCAGPVTESLHRPTSRTSLSAESAVRACRPSVGFVIEPTCVYPLEPCTSMGLFAWQRGLDIICALLGLVVLAPLFLLTALLIKLVSPGPVFFKQVRIGRGGKPFVLWKFRTMTTNADSSIHQNHVAGLIRSSAGNGETAKPMTKLDNDPRVIPLGCVLRGTCIDELPQLFNVLRGEMSLVGPRPPIPYEVKEYLRWQKRRLDVVPGLTGLWQVSGKNRLTFDEMVRLDIQYSRKRSFWMNVRIMFRTPLAIVHEIADAWVPSRERVPENA